MDEFLACSCGIVFGTVVFGAVRSVAQRALRCIEAGTEPTDLPTRLFVLLLMYLDASERG